MRTDMPRNGLRRRTVWLIDHDGMLAIPDRPGLGIDIDLDRLAEFSGADTSEYR